MQLEPKPLQDMRIEKTCVVFFKLTDNIYFVETYEDNGEMGDAFRFFDNYEEAYKDFTESCKQEIASYDGCQAEARYNDYVNGNSREVSERQLVVIK